MAASEPEFFGEEARPSPPCLHNEMKEPYYSIACWTTRLSPILFMGAVWFLCHYRFARSPKVWITLGIGYLIGVRSVLIYWDFAASMHPLKKLPTRLCPRTEPHKS